MGHADPCMFSQLNVRMKHGSITKGMCFMRPLRFDSYEFLGEKYTDNYNNRDHLVKQRICYARTPML